jgi:adenosine deaminase
MTETEFIRQLPKVLLHDHLDGGVRSSTLAELRGAPPEEIEAVYALGARAGSLGRYLEQFALVTEVLQSEDALYRVAREAGEDLLAETVIHAELRFAPELHTTGGLDEKSVIAAVHRGLQDSGLSHGLIIVAMRTSSPATTERIAKLAVEARKDAVVGFDLAGQEAGHGAALHHRATRTALEGGLGLTIHAGEAAGPESILEALDAGAVRLGHGVRLVDAPESLRRRVREAGVVLELCPSSNLHTGVCGGLDDHPVERLRRDGQRISVNTDNRSISRTSLTRELELVAGAFSWDEDTLREIMLVTADACFLPADQRAGLVERVLAGTGSPAGAGSPVSPGS